MEGLAGGGALRHAPLRHLYLRFTEARDLRGGDLLKPAPRVAAAFRHWAVRLRPEEKEEPTKGGQFDDVLKLDPPDMKFLGPVLHRLRERHGEKARLFSFSPIQMRDRWAWAQKALGVEHMNYVLRPPGAPRRSVEGRGGEEAHARGHPEARTLEVRSHAEQVREERQAPEVVRGHLRRHARLVRVLQGPPGLAAPRVHLAPAEAAGTVKGAAVGLEIFSGCARMSRALAAQGLDTESWDIADNPLLDLTKPDILRMIFAKLRSSFFGWARLARVSHGPGRTTAWAPDRCAVMSSPRGFLV